MQRIATMISLAIFVLILHYVSFSFEEEPYSQNGNSGDPAGQRQQPAAEPDHLSEQRITLPDRLGIDLSPGIHGNGENDSEVQESPELQGSRETGEVAEQRADEKPLTDQEIPFELNIIPEPDSKGCLPDSTDNDGFHFLLVGRKTGCPEIGLAMYVTLVPESHTRLTALNPSVVLIINNEYCLLKNTLQRGAGFSELGQALEVKTGLHPNFYIDLNLDGFVKMIDMLGGVNYRASRRVASTAPYLQAGLNILDGAKTLQFLKDERIGTVPKETLLINMLTAASDVDNTSLGLSLLWTGYHNIKTDLSLGDLLHVRRITQGISPSTITLREINPP